jgi:hypothetical protein
LNNQVSFKTRNIKILNNDIFKKGIYKWPMNIKEATERITEDLLDDSYDKKKLLEYFNLRFK